MNTRLTELAGGGRGLRGNADRGLGRLLCPALWPQASELGAGGASARSERQWEAGGGEQPFDVRCPGGPRDPAPGYLSNLDRALGLRLPLDTHKNVHIGFIPRSKKTEAT